MHTVIWKKSLANGTVVQITEKGGAAGWEANDGNSLLYLKPDSSGIWEKSIPDGDEALLIKADPSFVTVTSNSVFYIHPPQSAAQQIIMRYDLERQQSEEVATIPIKPVHYFSRWGFAVSPDEQWIYFSQVDKSESDLMLTEGIL